MSNVGVPICLRSLTSRVIIIVANTMRVGIPCCGVTSFGSAWATKRLCDCPDWHAYIMRRWRFERPNPTCLMARLGILLCTHSTYPSTACLSIHAHKIMSARLQYRYRFRRFADWWERESAAMTFPVKVFSKVLCNIASLRRVRAVGHGIYQTYTAFPYYCYYYYYYYHGCYNYHCRCCSYLLLLLLRLLPIPCYHKTDWPTPNRTRFETFRKDTSVVVIKQPNRSHTCSADVLLLSIRLFTNSVVTAPKRLNRPTPRDIWSLDHRRSEYQL